MPQPHSLGSIAGWRTTTLFTRTPGWAIAHRENTSMLNPNPPRVRSDRVNSTGAVREATRPADGQISSLILSGSRGALHACRVEYSKIGSCVGPIVALTSRAAVGEPEDS